MELEEYLKLFRPSIEKNLKSIVYENIADKDIKFRRMLTYHLGWDGEGAGVAAQGKRIRPILVLFCTASAGGKWEDGIPAAVAVELIHNFSLIHDDIQDNSVLRRGRPTVWSKWGVAQAINAGDLMFTLAYSSLGRLNGLVTPQEIVDAYHVLSTGCAELTKGQFLDLDFEKNESITLSDYYRMIEGKTAALLSVCSELGCIAAGESNPNRFAFKEYGHYLGMAFQIIDDWLGIWGNAHTTGKSNQSDLAAQKKTLPVIYMLDQSPEFNDKWLSFSGKQEEICEMVRIMDNSDVQQYVMNEADRYTGLAKTMLSQAAIQSAPSLALQSLTDILLDRKN